MKFSNIFDILWVLNCSKNIYETILKLNYQNNFSFKLYMHIYIYFDSIQFWENKLITYNNI